jgi:hypothetical protein
MDETQKIEAGEATAPTSGATPSAGNGSSAAADEMWRKTRIKVKTLEKENAELRAKEQEREAAAKTDLEKAVDRAKAEERARLEGEIGAVKRDLKVREALMGAGIKPEYAKMVDVGDDDGIADAVAEFARAHPELIPSEGARRAVGGGGTQGGAKPAPLSAEAIRDMDLKTFAERKDEIFRSLGQRAKEK